MQIVRQTEPGLCLAACVAMVTGDSLEAVCAGARILKSQDGVRFLPDNEAIKYLASRMMCYGLRVKPDGAVANDVDEFTVRVSAAIPAILAVPSKNFPGFQHAVVWDPERRMILDPLLDDPQPLADYEILEWVPVSHV